MTEKLDEIAATTALVIERDKLQRRVRDLERALGLIISQVHADHDGGSIADCNRMVCLTASRVFSTLPSDVFKPLVRRWLREHVEPASILDVADATGFLCADVERSLESMEKERLVERARDGLRWIAVETEGA